jgi:hypothetical protein
MTTLIEQRLSTDCMIACIAMALELPYEDALAAGIKTKAYDPENGEGTRDAEKILIELGLHDEWHWSLKKLIGHDRLSVSIGDFTSRRREWGEAPYHFVKEAWGRPAILSVPSLNKESGSHAVYYDGFNIYDPNPTSRKRYDSEALEEMEANTMLLFRPNIGTLLKRRRAMAKSAELDQ